MTSILWNTNLQNSYFQIFSMKIAILQIYCLVYYFEMYKETVVEIDNHFHLL